jgi:RNA polymerase sigma-70 factor (ECF subfamily)
MMTLRSSQRIPLVVIVSGLPAAPPALAVVRALPTQRSDTEVVNGLREGAPWARAALFDRYGADVERTLRRVLGHDRHTELADVVHDTFLQAFASVQKLRDAEALRAWMRSIATHTALRTIRSRSRRGWLRFHPPEELPEVSNDPQPEARDACHRTYRVLDRMKAEERVAFALRYLEGCEVAEVATLCGTSVSTLKRRLRRAEQRFVQLASGDEVLRHWIEEGGRWNP